MKEFSSKQSYSEIIDPIETQTENRPLSHLDKLSVVKGDATETIPSYMIDNTPPFGGATAYRF